MIKKISTLAALRGENIGGAIPFAPRMDLWYIANRARGTLPESLRDLDLPRLAEVLDIGCHALKADLTLPRPAADYTLLGLGLENHAHFPFRFAWDDLDIRFTVAGEQMTTIIATPHGELRIEMDLTWQMLCDGISMPFVQRYPLQSAADIAPLCHVFEHIRVVPTTAGFQQFSTHVGDSGLPVASGMPAASPMHLILHNLTPIENFWYLYNDEPEAMRRLAAAIEPVYEAVLRATLACDAGVFYWGSNYDQSVTHPPFFRQEIAPWLSHAAQSAHAVGKMLLTHADGNNGALLDLYPSCGVDVLESVCTEPMIPITMRGLVEAVSGRCALWGGIPSVMLLPQQVSTADFDLFLDEFFDQLGACRRCVIGVSDNVPPEADLNRIIKINDKCRLNRLQGDKR